MFQKSILDKYLSNLNEIEVTKAFSNLSDFFDSIKNIKEAKEEQYQSGFLNDFFVKALGYTLFPKDGFNLTTELKNESDSKKADGAILKDSKVVAVIELKSTKTKSMDKIVNQAFTYKNNHPTCKYVITSNFEKLRLYIEYSNEFIEFNLFNLTFESFKTIYLLLHKDNLLSDLPKIIKEASKESEESITNRFYKEYSKLRIKLFENLKANNQIDEIELLRLTQKLLDRLIFIFFAEDKYIINNKTTKTLIEYYKNSIGENGLYYFVKIGFKAIDKGNKKLNINAYNGGLFRDDELLDNLIISDNILEEILNLEKYDFDSEIDVNILGHIFENSLSDLEEIRASILNESIDKSKSKRKKDGVFYTPSYITHYIVENTLGKICSDKKEELGLINLDIKPPKNYKKLTKKESELKDKLEEYREFLLGLTILDPACGSGAFLNEAFNFLMREHDFITENEKILFGGGMFGFTDVDTQILEKNLFGVDINEEAIEIARLSLWLKTAKQGRKLTNLNEHIKVGNSLIDDKEVDSKAFKWEEEFKEVFDNGGFDVVIGNPPYFNIQTLGAKSKIANFIQKSYPEIWQDKSDIIFYFIAKAIQLTKNKVGFIISNAFMFSDKAQKIRNYILDNAPIEKIVNFEKYMVFDDASITTAIIELNKNKKENLCYAYSFKDKDYLENYISQIINNYDNYFKVELEKDKVFALIDKRISSINKKIDSNYKKLNTLFKIGKGMETAGNKVFLFENYPKQFPKEFIKKRMSGEIINKFNFDNPKEYLLYYENIKNFEELPLSIQNHLLENKNFLENRATVKNEGRLWWKYSRPMHKDYYQLNKIWCSYRAKENIFCFDNTKNFIGLTNTTVIFDTNENLNLKYLLVLLNSKVLNFRYKSIGKQTGSGIYEYFENGVGKLPIPKIDETQQKPFIEKADLILKLNEEFTNIKNEFLNELQTHYNLDKLSKKLENFFTLTFEEFINEVTKVAKLKLQTAKEKRDIKNYWSELFEEESQKLKTLQESINKTDREIDEMVYKLYGLSEDEIRVIENE